MAHLVRRAAEADYVPPDPANPGYTRWGVVGEDVAVHTGFDICALEPGASAVCGGERRIRTAEG